MRKGLLILSLLAVFFVGNVSITAAATPVKGDLSSKPVVIRHLPYSMTQDIMNATASIDDPRDNVCSQNRLEATVWYKFTPQSPITVAVDTKGSTYDTVVLVYQGVPQADQTNWVTCNDDRQDSPSDPNNYLTSRATFAAQAGITYYILIGRYINTPAGTLVVSVQQDTAAASALFGIKQRP